MSITPYTFDLEPGQSKHQTFGDANYIFVDFADRTVEVLINNTWQSLRKGSTFRSKTGLFDRFDIRNPDPDRPCRVVMFIGTDEVSNQIIEGEITVAPGIRAADGSFKADRRQEIGALIVPNYPAISRAYEGGEIIQEVDALDSGGQETIVLDGSARPIDKMLGYWREGDDLVQLLYVGSGNSRFIVERRFDADLNKTGERLVDRVLGNAFLTAGTRINGRYLYFTSYGEIIQPDTTDDVSLHSAWVELIDLAGIDGNSPLYGATLHPSGIALTIAGASDEVIRIINPDSFATVASYVTADFSESNTWTEDPHYASYDPINDRWSLGCARSSHHLVYSGDLSQLIHNRVNFYDDQLAGYVGGSGAGRVIMVGNYLYGNFRASATGEKALVRKYVVEDSADNVQGQAYDPDCYSPFVRRDLPGNVTTAAVQITDRFGLSELSGELIRAVLELYYGRILEPDFLYLDHVYQLTVEGQNGSVFQVQTQANGSSFAALGIADDFTALFPARVRLTVDDQLKTITKLGA